MTKYHKLLCNIKYFFAVAELPPISYSEAVWEQLQESFLCVFIF